ncbi:MAG: efflux RND transporter permease subunit [Phycisphaerales bacterium]|nr:MAG: efflux RND transporter permease subunit [Phycisphaerales bacterium]
MGLLRLCIERPVTVAVGAIIIVLLGLLSLSATPVQLTPNVDQTVITVTTRWSGASPAEVESEIVRPQEEKLRGVTNLVKMSSASRQDEGSINLEFAVGTSREAALREVSDKLREVSRYPDNVDEPVVTAGDDRNRDYIAWIIVRNPNPGFDVREMYDFFEDRVKPFLERADGLSEIRVLGGREREVQVLVDAEAMAARGVTFDQLASALRRENVNASAGQLAEGKRDVRLRVIGEYENLEQILDTVVTDRAAVPTRVRDIAEAVLTLRKPTSVVRSKGETALAMNAQREPGSNVLRVMDGLKGRINELNAPGGMLEQESRRLGLENSVHLDQVYDQTVYIKSSLELVRNNIYIGGALAVLCLLTFLRSWRATIIVGVTIPVSIIGSFVVLVLLGRNINVISLAGMAFAVGMVVDNAIVVLENIYRRRQAGDDAPVAAYRGGAEVWAAVLVSTLTTVIVFVPVLTIEEEVGQLFRDIALAICAAVLLSLVASITIIPAATSRLLRKPVGSTGRDVSGRSRPRRAWERMRVGLAERASGAREFYGSTLNKTLGSWTMRAGVVATISITSAVGAFLLIPPATYLPAGNRNLVFAFMIPPPGYNLDMQIDLGMRVEESLRPYWEVQAGTPEARALPAISMRDNRGRMREVTPPPIDNFFFVSFGGGMFMGAMSQEETNVAPLASLLSHAARPDVLPGVFSVPFQVPLFNVGGFGAGNSIELEVSGDDLNEVRDAASAIMGEAFALVGEGVFQSVRPDPGNFNIPAQEVQVILDRVRASEVGMTVADAALVVQALGDGAIVGEYTLGGERIDLRVMEQRQRDWRAPGLSFQDMASTPVATPSGRVVPLGSLASMRRVDSPQQINRIESLRSVTLSITTAPGTPLEASMDVVRDRLIDPLREQGAISPMVLTNLSGAAGKLTQVRETMLGEWGGGILVSLISLFTSRLFLALLFVYLLMCALFESWMYPFVIMVSVPLALIGGILGLRIVHTFVPTQQLDTLTMLGFVILVGIVVNNSVLIVTQALNFMRGFGENEFDDVERMPPRKAIVESAKSRLRPIMMTTSTSVLGMSPLVLQPGAGSELYRGLGAVVIGGLLCSSIFTLVLAPMLLSLAIDGRIALSRLFGRTWDPGEVVRIMGKRAVPGEPATGPVVATSATKPVTESLNGAGASARSGAEPHTTGSGQKD